MPEQADITGAEPGTSDTGPARVDGWAPGAANAALDWYQHQKLAMNRFPLSIRLFPTVNNTGLITVSASSSVVLEQTQSTAGINRVPSPGCRRARYASSVRRPQVGCACRTRRFISAPPFVVGLATDREARAEFSHGPMTARKRCHQVLSLRHRCLHSPRHHAPPRCGKPNGKVLPMSSVYVLPISPAAHYSDSSISVVSKSRRLCRTVTMLTRCSATR